MGELERVVTSSLLSKESNLYKGKELKLRGMSEGHCCEIDIILSIFYCWIHDILAKHFLIKLLANIYKLGGAHGGG